MAKSTFNYRYPLTQRQIVWQCRANACDNHALRMARFLQSENLVSFFSGEVSVVYLCNFAWQVKRLGMLPHPPILTRAIKIALQL